MGETEISEFVLEGEDDEWEGKMQRLLESPQLPKKWGDKEFKFP